MLDGENTAAAPTPTLQEAAWEAGARARAQHATGANCAQCVACALANEVGLDPDLAYRLMEGFGGGMGNRSQTCGAVSGAVLALSAASSDGPVARTSKQRTYERVAALVETLEVEFGGTRCCDIRPTDPDAVKPACEGYIARAAEEACKAIAAIKGA